MSPHKSFLVCGAQFPEATQWPVNVRRFEHAEPGEHAALYSSSRFTLNITRREMVRFGYCPSGRLFEAIGSGVQSKPPDFDVGTLNGYRQAMRLLDARENARCRSIAHFSGS